MNKYFGINLEFDSKKIFRFISQNIDQKQKGYVCFVDMNVLSIAQKNIEYKKILNNSNINSCDGSSIAWLAGLIYRKKFKSLNGPEIFNFYIENNKYKQLLLGNTEVVVDKIRQKIMNKGINTDYIYSLSLPFCSVDDFDYKMIAQEINNIQPDIIWVSLGAPKQEIFMSKLLPYLNNGLMFGIGAAFNFYIGDINIPIIHIGSLRFIWISRLIREPKKQIKRILPFIKLIPKLYIKELKKK